jgi:hypothetical protein
MDFSAALTPREPIFIEYITRKSEANKPTPMTLQTRENFGQIFTQLIGNEVKAEL